MDINQSLGIILVEDDIDDAVLTIQVLQKNKMVKNQVHLKNGKEALDFMFGEGEYFGRDLCNNSSSLLLDLKMPRMSGLEVLKIIKSDKRIRSIPVSVLISSKENPDSVQCYMLGVNSYIIKPIEYEVFSDTVTQIGFYWLSLNHPPVQ